MELCDDGHEKVCFDGRDCPACVEKDRANDLEKQVDRLEARVAEMEDSK